MRSLVLSLAIGLALGNPVLAETRAERQAAEAAARAAEKARQEEQQQIRHAISVNKRGYGQGKYHMDLDNFRGWVSSVEGGSAVADVVLEKTASGTTKKHVGNVKYEDITFVIGPDAPPMDFQAGPTLHKGALVRFGPNGLPVERLEFFDATIVALDLPRVSANLRRRQRDGLTVTLRPGFTRTVRTPKGAPLPPPGPDYPRLAGPNSANLASATVTLVTGGGTPSRFEIEGSVDAVAQRAIATEAVGETRPYEQSATSVQVPNFVITLAEGDSKELFAWHQKFVVEGNSTDKDEGAISIEYSNGRGRTLWTATFANVGLFRLDGPRATSSGPVVDVGIYAEDLLVERGSVPLEDEADPDD